MAGVQATTGIAGHWDATLHAQLHWMAKTAYACSNNNKKDVQLWCKSVEPDLNPPRASQTIQRVCTAKQCPTLARQM
jgi:hypothetical protein